MRHLLLIALALVAEAPAESPKSIPPPAPSAFSSAPAPEGNPKSASPPAPGAFLDAPASEGSPKSASPPAPGAFLGAPAPEGTLTSDSPSPSPGSVQHLVVCWLKEPGNASHRQSLINASLNLRTIPGVTHISAGTPIPSDRPIVEASFDVALVFTFTNNAAMQAYLTHPDHQQLLRELVQPLTSRVLVYDFTEHPRSHNP